MKKKSFCIVNIFLFFVITSYAQNQNNIWYFGENAGLDFNSGSPVALTNGMLNTWEGSATISDATGHILFYTDGITVWNKLHSPMPNGNGLLGDVSSTQSALIVPKPRSTTIYYIFTTPAEGATAGLCYSEVDMTLDGGLGDVVTTAKNVPLVTPIDEKITAVKNSNNEDFWVIVHGYMTADYYVYAVTSAGVTTTAISSTAGSSDTSGTGVGYLKSSNDGSKLVSAASNNYNVDILNFDNTAGTVTFDFNFAFHYAYGVEFSPDGTKLYVAAWSGVNIYQYDMTLGSSAAIIASETSICTSASLSGFGALQNAPDGKMYASEPYSSYLGAITNPNTIGVACGYVDFAIYLAGRQPIYGLPNFTEGLYCNSSSSPIITSSAVAATCNTPGSASIAITGGTPPYNITWNTFPVQHGTNAVNLPAGSYTVKISDSSCKGHFTMDTVVVPASGGAFSSVPSIPYKCIGNASIAIINSGGVSPYSFSWSSTIADTNAIYNLSPGTYSVTVTDGAGCTNVFSELIIDSIVIHYSFTGDIKCFNDATTLSIHPIGGVDPYTINWTIPVATGQSIDDVQAGDFAGTITDNIGCVQPFNYTLTQPSLLTATIVTAHDSVCPGATITLFAIAGGGTPGYDHHWSGIAGTGTDTSYTYSPAVNDTVSFTVTDANNCIAHAQLAITLIIEDPSITSVAPLSVSDTSITLTAATEGGTWSGAGITDSVNGTFSPAIAGVGIHLITYTLTTPCLYSGTAFIVVNPSTVGIDEIENYAGITIYPNPYSDFTNIVYSLTQKSTVSIEVYNVIGERIAILLNASQTEGEHMCQFSAKEKGLNAGVYFVKITVDGKASMKKIVEM